MVIATAIPSALTAPARASLLRQAGGSDASREIKAGIPRGKPPLTPHLISVRRALHRKFFKVLSSAKNKCAHCNTHSCAMRTEGGYKIFCVPLSARAAAANQILGGDIAARVAGRGGAASPVGGEEDEEEEDGDGGDDDDDDEDAPLGRRRGTSASAADGAAAGTVSGAKAAAGVAAGSLVFMSASEAQRHIQDLWQAERALLRSILPHLTPSAFFLHVVPVPPNRFRPPSKVRPPAARDGLGPPSHPSLLPLSPVPSLLPPPPPPPHSRPRHTSSTLLTTLHSLHAT